VAGTRRRVMNTRARWRPPSPRTASGRALLPACRTTWAWWSGGWATWPRRRLCTGAHWPSRRSWVRRRRTSHRCSTTSPRCCATRTGTTWRCRCTGAPWRLTSGGWGRTTRTWLSRSTTSRRCTASTARRRRRRPCTAARWPSSRKCVASGGGARGGCSLLAAPRS
jgi:hypothetical protein